MSRYLYIFFLLLGIIPFARAQKPLFQRMANTTIAEVLQEERFTGNKGLKWTYDIGVPLEGILATWRATGNVVYFDAAKKWMDKYVDKQGNILNYRPDEFNIDHVKNGKVLLTLFKVTNDKRYLEACNQLYGQMIKHPRTREGGFWHKKIYPNQMWLDGLYMAQPFLTEYAELMAIDGIYDDIVNQFVWMEKNAKDTKTGLLYHGWDESKQEKWANPTTGLSPHFWARGMGWYVMALIDVLDYFPQDHSGYQTLVNILNRTINAIVAYQDPATGVWYDIVDLGDRKGNYVEASASSMYVYALAKGIRKGYLSDQYIVNVQRAHQGLVKEFITEVDADNVNLNKVVAVSGLGGAKNYRDGSFAYYMSEPVVSNDPKGVGPFMLADIEYHSLQNQLKKNKKVNVTLDNYYNNETKEIVKGLKRPYHYLWDGQDNNGFYALGNIFESYGATLHTLAKAPNKRNLRNANIYIIVDPDTEKESLKPNYMNAAQARDIAHWVKTGGVLVLLLNDSGNCDLDKINILSSKFGITFNNDSQNRVQGKNYDQGAVSVSTNALFQSNRKLYLKEIATIAIHNPAQALVQQDGNIIMATAKYGKGTVFAVGDPWLYNEYVDGRKLPAEYENFDAGRDWVSWLIDQVMN